MVNKKLLFVFLIFCAVNIFLFYNIDKIFSSKLIEPIIKNIIKKGDVLESKKTRIVLGGDVMLGRSVLTKSESLGDYSYPFNKIRGFLKGSDLVFVNLEAPIVENCPRTDGGMIFCTDPKMIQGLIDANIKVVNLENNHTLNYGQKGLGDTKKYLLEKGINFVGYGETSIQEINNIRFGFIGFDFVSKKLSEKDLSLIAKTKTSVDILIVSVHWGSEYQKKAGSVQRDIAKKLVNNGADVIVGHHPHWVQDFEKIDNSLVYYSLGNMVFDQMWSEETKKGLLVELTFDGLRLIRDVRTPIRMDNLGQPSVVGI